MISHPRATSESVQLKYRHANVLISSSFSALRLELALDFIAPFPNANIMHWFADIYILFLGYTFLELFWN